MAKRLDCAVSDAKEALEAAVVKCIEMFSAVQVRISPQLLQLH